MSFQHEVDSGASASAPSPIPSCLLSVHTNVVVHCPSCIIILCHRRLPIGHNDVHFRLSFIAQLVRLIQLARPRLPSQSASSALTLASFHRLFFWSFYHVLYPHSISVFPRPLSHLHRFRCLYSHMNYVRSRVFAVATSRVCYYLYCAKYLSCRLLPSYCLARAPVSCIAWVLLARRLCVDTRNVQIMIQSSFYARCQVTTDTWWSKSFRAFPARFALTNKDRAVP